MKSDLPLKNALKNGTGSEQYTPEAAKSGCISVPVPIFQHATNLAQLETEVLPAGDASLHSSGATDPRVFAAVEHYLRQCEASPPPDIDEFVAAHPDIADELRACLAGLAFLQKAAPNIELSSAAITASAMMDQVGHEPLGDYRLIRELGRGGMGVVYEAEQLSLSRRVALKVLPFAAVLDPRHLQRFKNEALAAAHLAHPNIVDVYGVGCERGIHFYAMRLIEGQTLAAVISECCDSSQLSFSKDEARKNSSNGNDARTEIQSGDKSSHSKDTVAAALSTLRTTKPRDFFRRVAELGIQAAEALDHAHQMGIVHRDIKPSNLMIECSHLAPRDAATPRPLRGEVGRGVNANLTADHRPLTTPKLWITDFGLAHFQNEPGMTMTGDLIGTLRYMSPEQAEGNSAILDHRTDIYSFGATLYELLTLRPAFPTTDRQTLLRQIAGDDPPAPRKLNPEIPTELETILLKSTAKDATDRYQSAGELADDLHRFLKQQPLLARRLTRVDRAVKWMRRRVLLVAAVSLVLLVVTAVLGASAWMIGSARDQARFALAEANTKNHQLADKTSLARDAVEYLRHQHTAILAVSRDGGTVRARPGGPAWLAGLVGPDHLNLFQEVTSVHLGRAPGAGLEFLKDVPETFELLIDGAQGYKVTDDDLHHLRHLKKLGLLTLANLQISDAAMQSLRDLDSLETLVIQNCPITDRGLARARLNTKARLASLVLNGTLVAGNSLAQLAGSQALVVLVLGDNPQLQDASLAHIGSMRALTVLDLHSTPITDDGLAHLKRLGELTTLLLHFTKIEGSGLVQVEFLPKLNLVSVVGTKVPPAAVEKLKRARPNLTVTADSQP
jgi:serine/threonine protein kinase